MDEKINNDKNKAKQGDDLKNWREIYGREIT